MLSLDTENALDTAGTGEGDLDISPPSVADPNSDANMLQRLKVVFSEHFLRDDDLTVDSTSRDGFAPLHDLRRVHGAIVENNSVGLEPGLWFDKLPFLGRGDEKGCVKGTVTKLVTIWPPNRRLFPVRIIWVDDPGRLNAKMLDISPSQIRAIGAD